MENPRPPTSSPTSPPVSKWQYEWHGSESLKMVEPDWKPGTVRYRQWDYAKTHPPKNGLTYSKEENGIAVRVMAYSPQFATKLYLFTKCRCCGEWLIFERGWNLLAAREYAGLKEGHNPICFNCFPSTDDIKTYFDQVNARPKTKL